MPMVRHGLRSLNQKLLVAGVPRSVCLSSRNVVSDTKISADSFPNECAVEIYRQFDTRCGHHVDVKANTRHTRQIFNWTENSSMKCVKLLSNEHWTRPQRFGQRAIKKNQNGYLTQRMEFWASNGREWMHFVCDELIYGKLIGMCERCKNPALNQLLSGATTAAGADGLALALLWAKPNLVDSACVGENVWKCCPHREKKGIE